MKWFLLLTCLLISDTLPATTPDGENPSQVDIASKDGEERKTIPILLFHLEEMGHFIPDSREVLKLYGQLWKSSPDRAWFLSNLWREKVNMAYGARLKEKWSAEVKRNWGEYEKLSASELDIKGIECQKFTHFAYYLEHLLELKSMIEAQLLDLEKGAKIVQDRLKELRDQRAQWFEEQRAIEAEKLRLKPQSPQKP